MTAVQKVHFLIENGANISCPESVYIDDDIDINSISTDITIFPGCRLNGAETAIGSGCSIGKDGPVTIHNCQLAENVTLKGGTFDGATLLSGSSFGPSAQVRPATIMEEESSCAHSVGLKQTILFPFVTLGSLINFCDCFMSGGTSRKNHSEVGSSYIHFNYTPHQDKATASLIGDVPRGVMLNQAPIFLGGQGGLVGPSVIEYGVITAAGSICRKDIKEAGKLIYDKTLPARYDLPYQPGAYGDVSRIIKNNILYIGNLFAMRMWYRNVRSQFTGDSYPQFCHDGAEHKIELIITERLSRMTQLAENMARSLEIAKEKLDTEPSESPLDKQIKLQEKWPEIENELQSNVFDTDTEKRDAFLSELPSATGSYIETIQTLTPESAQKGSAWMQSIVDNVLNLWQH